MYASPKRSSGFSNTERWAFAVVKRTATAGPLPSPNVYRLPPAVVTVKEPWRMNRRKKILSNQSTSVSNLLRAATAKNVH
jgi:hypothetical protein